MNNNEFLKRLHAIVAPRTYVEIGIRHGASLSVSDAARNIAVDPRFSEEDMQYDVENVEFYKSTSDEFFARPDVAEIAGGEIDLGYIDGLHLFEYALRDFIGLSRLSGERTVIIFDDILPRNATEADRQPTGGAWTGDVWKIVPTLRRHLPDLFERSIIADNMPRGCLIVPFVGDAGAAITERYDAIVSEALEGDMGHMPGPDVLDRVRPADEALDALRRTLAGAA